VEIFPMLPWLQIPQSVQAKHQSEYEKRELMKYAKLTHHFS